MTFRQSLKYWLHSRCPGVSGRFSYYQTQVYFPPDSWVFRAACEQGIYEAEIVRLLESLATPNTTVFDVGANIGLMAIPLLRACPTCAVVSFEASPTVLPYLRRTVAGNEFGGRWKLIESAIGNTSGVTTFSVSPRGEDQFDGIRRTARSSSSRVVEVPIAKLHDVWLELGKPRVSVIKCDVEGAELDVLNGARECLKATKAAIVTEWNRNNQLAYHTKPELLLEFASDFGYRVFTIPHYVEVIDAYALKVQMLRTDNFLLINRDLAV